MECSSEDMRKGKRYTGNACSSQGPKGVQELHPVSVSHIMHTNDEENTYIHHTHIKVSLFHKNGINQND
jgi:hypothetical protein